MIRLSCRSCGAKLELTEDIDRFSCAHCGSEWVVNRSGGIISLKAVEEEKQASKEEQNDERYGLSFKERYRGFEKKCQELNKMLESKERDPYMITEKCTHLIHFIDDAFSEEEKDKNIDLREAKKLAEETINHPSMFLFTIKTYRKPKNPPKNPPKVLYYIAFIFTFIVMGIVLFPIFFPDYAQDIFLGKSLPRIRKRETVRKVEKSEEIVKNSAWDGSVRQVDTWIKKNLKDPGSVEYIEWSKVVKKEGGGYLVRVKYRDKNSFGGYVIEEKVVILDSRGNVISFYDK